MALTLGTIELLELAEVYRRRIENNWLPVKVEVMMSERGPYALQLTNYLTGRGLMVVQDTMIGPNLEYLGRP